MKYTDFYKILHRRNPYNVKFIADYLSLIFSFENFDYDSENGIFSLDRHSLLTMDSYNLNLLSKVISKHGYYDAFLDDQFLIIPHLWKK